MRSLVSPRPPKTVVIVVGLVVVALLGRWMQRKLSGKGPTSDAAPLDPASEPDSQEDRDNGSWRSRGSLGSARSLGSIGSFCSIGCIGSSFSIGSIGSSFSIGSIGSFASIGSIGSLVSVGSVFSIGGLLAASDCGRALKP